ncbi:FHA domain-containing protein [Piscicoccus intestinalis]|uniref:FHA domain-containing protein n=1 Tax=Piscicoccus intestinalis TaxID=746033 RepID=UPI000838B6CF|nr:FHA domain-containing protein [Piscicoccus intestinalis]
MKQHDIRDEAALTISGEGRRWSLAAGAQVVIGRSADADIRIDDPEVSRRHAQLVATGPGGWVVSDLGSVNGTYVDGRRVTSADVGDGSVIALGPDPRAPRLTLTGAGSGAGASGGGDADSAAGPSRVARGRRRCPGPTPAAAGRGVRTRRHGSCRRTSTGA